ncbi:hypothetical protein HY501_02115 [Candidatus Woesearchaeota archaeon]|nr:hypothetical protein [Candidatus Woesearchaeota archaeon]
MTLDDLANQSFLARTRYGIAHSLIVAKDTVMATAAIFAAYPTIHRKIRESRSIQNSTQQEPPTSQLFLDDVVRSIALNSTIAAHVVLMLSSVEYDILLAATNGISLLYETGRAVKKRIAAREEEKGQELPETSLLTCGYQWASNAAKHLANSIQQAASNFPKNAGRATHRIARSAGVYLGGYAVMSMLSLGHYAAFDASRYTVPAPGKVNVALYECSPSVGERHHKFYLMGEIHLYNHSSAVAVSHFIDSHSIDVLLSEGAVEATSPKPELKLATIAEDAYFASLLPLLYGTGLRYPDAGDLSKERGIPIVWLEKFDDEGRREGMSTASTIFIGGAGLFFIAAAPYVYLSTAIANQLGISPLSSPLFRSLAGGIETIPNQLVHGRNSAMARTAMAYIDAHPDSTPLIRVGDAHVRGMIGLLQQRHDQTECVLLGKAWEGQEHKQ